MINKNKVEEKASVIHRLRAPSFKEFEEYRTTIDQPAVLENVITGWPAVNKWSIKYFQEKWGAFYISACANDNGEHRYKYSYPESIMFSQFLDRITKTDGSERKYFLAQLRLIGDFASATDDILIPECIPIDNVEMVSLWMAAKGTATHLHWDSHPGMLALIQGCKAVRLYSPELFESMYPVAESELKLNWSQVDFLRPDTAEFPRYINAPSTSVDLVAGELLYIPQYWWHSVKNLDFSIGTQFFLTGKHNSHPWAAFYCRRQAIRAGRIQP
ncbi:cupin-like domain-containing protein [Nostoc sp. CHAB 5834]|nr:cupin-like domain-containing protein [Nostoc sp. CHAB 5834]